MADSAYESVLCVKNEVFVYRIPPRPSNRGYRAADWKLDAPDWTGRLRVVAVNKDLSIKLEDKNSGELFAQCPVEEYPGIALESVMDSSRYFVLRIQDPSGKSAFIGIGFSDRSDSFDMNVALQDHFKWLKQEVEAAKATTELTQGPKLDLGFKAGQTIKLNIGNKKGDGGARSKPKPRTTGGILPPPPGSGGILPPPPGNSGIRLPPPSSGGGGGISGPPSGSMVSGSGSAPSPQSTATSGSSSNMDLLFDLDPVASQSSGAAPLVPAQPPTQPALTDMWGDFSGASNSSSPAPVTKPSSDNSWVQF